MSASRGRHHVYLSSNYWDGLWIIQQPTAREIARNETVLYVERFVSVFTILRHRKYWSALVRWLAGARRINDNLRVLAPLPLFHLGHRLPWLFRIEMIFQRAWIRFWARSMRGPRVLWLDNPIYESAIGRMGEQCVVYHVGDEISEFSTSDAALLRELEERVLRRSDVVFAAAEELARDKRRLNDRVETIWNAIDQTVFNESGESANELLPEIPRPRVIFVGVVDTWVDTELLGTCARGLPNVQFLIVGPRSPLDAALTAIPNIHFLGRRPRQEIPRLLAAANASLIPFRKTLLTRRLVPLKLFEALAAGIMPVATDFSPDLDILEARGLVRLGRDPQEFIRQLRSTIERDSIVERERLAAYGRQQTWAQRWRQMNMVLEEAGCGREIMA